MAHLLPDHRQAHEPVLRCVHGPCVARHYSPRSAPIRVRRRHSRPQPDRPPALVRQKLHRHRARRARYRVLPVLRHRSRSRHRIHPPQIEMPRLDGGYSPRQRLRGLHGCKNAAGQRPAMATRNLRLLPRGPDLCDRLWRVCRQRFVRCDARRPPRAA